MAGGEDAIRLHNFRDVLIEDNEIFGVIENGGHNDCLQSVWGGDGLTFRRNYLHDNNCQTFFLKDGHTSNIVFSDNLSVRNRDGDAEVVGQIWNSSNVSITNNTIWDESALYVRYGSVADIFPDGPVENYTAFNNVIENFVPYDDFESDDNHAGIFTDPDVLEEDFNLFGGGWSWVPEHMGAHSIQDSTPAFINATDSAGEDLASGDFRLASPITKSGVTYDAGITWLLAGRRFGPDAYVAPTCHGVAATIVGTSGADTLVGTPGGDVIAGREGNDTISGLNGDDLVCGDTGKDVVLGGNGDDELYGGGGVDTIRGGLGPDTVVGGSGNDLAFGDSGPDTLGGGVGADDLPAAMAPIRSRATPERTTCSGATPTTSSSGSPGRTPCMAVPAPTNATAGPVRTRQTPPARANPPSRDRDRTVGRAKPGRLRDEWSRCQRYEAMSDMRRLA